MTRATSRRRAAAALATLAAATALVLTGCSPGASAKPGGAQSVSGADEATVKDMQQKLDDAESAAAQADSDAAQNN
ncbi:hypothetical protein [Streptomyces sp. NRRL S-244]|uniref:hypothetical protein n=1 Tax=Streptomyces sp. NRRL S-244 TaxID=1463897 RepID=UPI0004C2001E|nr:hypothetical protein [Streptomyces sp. NRRL S-244]